MNVTLSMRSKQDHLVQKEKSVYMEKVNIAEKLSLFSERRSPKIVAELNGQHVKLVKIFW
jgi:hypothetical protein